MEDNFDKEVRYTYDALGRITDIDEYDEDNTLTRSAAKYSYDYGYVHSGTTYFHSVTIEDAMGNTTTNLYDMLGRPVKTVYDDGDVTENTYDLNHNLTITIDRNAIDMRFTE